MAGQLVPLVLLPRYTTYAGASTFQTIAMDVTQYSSAIVNVWRGALVGGTPTIGFRFEESSDQNTWTDCAIQDTQPVDPGTEAEMQWTATLTRRWFRITVTLGGTDPVGTCWAVGFLEERLT